MRPWPFRAFRRPEPLRVMVFCVALGLLAGCNSDDPEDPAKPAETVPAADQPESTPATNGSTEAADKESAPVAAGPLPPVDAANPLAGPRRALTSFLDGATWQERLAVTYQADQLEETIAAYYADGEHSDGPIDSYEMEFFHLDESGEDGGPYYIFFVSTPEHEDGFPVIVRGTAEGSKVDWECFAEFHDRHFRKYHESGAAGPRQFRVVLKRTTYFGPDRSQFADLDNYLCCRVDLPYTEEDFYAFLSKDDPLAESVGEKISWGSKPLAAIVRFERADFAHGPSHLKIVDLVTEGWHRDPAAAVDR